MTEKEKEQTHFGYETIDSEEKEGRVGAVFDSVAGKYDLMNDVMSAGIHRAWKNWYVWQTGVKPGEAVLDLAAGTGDITLASPSGCAARARARTSKGGWCRPTSTRQC